MVDEFILLSRTARGNTHIFSVGRPSDLTHFVFFVDFKANKVVIDRGKYFNQLFTDLNGMENFFNEQKIDHKKLFSNSGVLAE